MLLHKLEGKDLLMKPRPVNLASEDKRNKDYYYMFHNDYGHDTEQGFALRDEIKELVQLLYLIFFNINAINWRVFKIQFTIIMLCTRYEIFIISMAASSLAQ